MHPSTPTYMVLGEIGKLPLKTSIDKRIISFWGRMVNGNNSKLAYALYKKLLQNVNGNSWPDVKRTCIWLNQNCTQLEMQQVKQRKYDLGIHAIL